MRRKNYFTSFKISRRQKKTIHSPIFPKTIRFDAVFYTDSEYDIDFVLNSSYNDA